MSNETNSTTTPATLKHAQKNRAGEVIAITVTLTTAEAAEAVRATLGERFAARRHALSPAKWVEVSEAVGGDLGAALKAIVDSVA